MTDPLPESELSAIAARADAATPEPWRVATGFPTTVLSQYLSDNEADGTVAYESVAECPTWGLSNSEADAAFIAAARSDVPALVAEVRRLRAAVEALTPLARLGLNARQWAAENMQNVEEVLEIARQAVDRLAEINASKQGNA